MQNCRWSKYQKILCRPAFWGAVWLLTVLVCAVLKYAGDSYNNYQIFKYGFWHLIERLPLYAPYPEQYGDLYHYLPPFGIFMAPFAVLPDWLGMPLYVLAISAGLFFAVKALPLAAWQHAFILLLSVNELYTAVAMQQFNIAIAAVIIGAFALIEKEEERWAALLIVLGALTKIYGIAGAAVFFFSRHKLRFIGWMLLWGFVFTGVTALAGGADYLVEQCRTWLSDIAAKNSENLFALYQNISLLGFVRKVSGCAGYSDLWLIGGGLLLYSLPLLRFRQYANLRFRMMLLASTLLFVVLFSTGSESSSYIIALIGVLLWFVVTPSKNNSLNVSLLLLALLLTSLSSTDIFPRFVRDTYIRPYALKALPCTLIWLKLCAEMLLLDFKDKTANRIR